MKNMTIAFSRTQIIIAVVLSVVGTLMLSTVGFAILYKSRRRRQQGRMQDLKSDIQRSDTDSSTGGGGGGDDMVWNNGLNEKQRAVEQHFDNLSVARAMSKDEDYGDEYKKDGYKQDTTPRLSSRSGIERRVDWPFRTIIQDSGSVAR